jgi:hypothetical protein
MVDFALRSRTLVLQRVGNIIITSEGLDACDEWTKHNSNPDPQLYSKRLRKQILDIKTAATSCRCLTIVIVMW